MRTKLEKTKHHENGLKDKIKNHKTLTKGLKKKN
jgi:hypothetical protein